MFGVGLETLGFRVQMSLMEYKILVSFIFLFFVKQGKKKTFPSTSFGVFCNYLIKRTNIPGDV